MKLPQTFIAAVRYFADPDNCLNYLVSRRWPNGVECPTCGSKDVRFLANQRRWWCKGQHPRKQFSIKNGTVLEDSPIGLDKWLPAVWMIATCRNGVSSYEIHRDLGVTQKTAWFILHRIREAMQSEEIAKMPGPVEVDEAYVGGKAHSVHRNPETAKLMPTDPQENKTIVMGIVQRKGKARAFVVEDTTRETLHDKIKEHVAERATVYTDSLKSYGKLTAFTHFTINHSKQYVDGHIHTNGVENFWVLLKRMIKGTYICPRSWHLQRYVEEQVFRFNSSGVNDAYRFDETMKQIFGKRLTYKRLTATVDLQQLQTKKRQKLAAIKRASAEQVHCGP
jgi:transposase-like protein